MGCTHGIAADVSDVWESHATGSTRTRAVLYGAALHFTAPGAPPPTATNLGRVDCVTRHLVSTERCAVFREADGLCHNRICPVSSRAMYFAGSRRFLRRCGARTKLVV